MIDTHCHIDEMEFAEDRDEVIVRQRETGVEAIVVPGVNTASVTTVMDVCNRYPRYLYPALGLHPEEVKENWHEELETIDEAVHTLPIVAIGEIGLDYHWDVVYKHEQHEVLHTQLDWAKELDLPVIIHNRDSIGDMLPLLKSHPGVRGVFHCFNESKEVCREVLKMGYILGIGGVLTFKNCKLADTLVEAEVPIQRIVLETDAPYMAPVPMRGKRNESRYMKYVAERLAEVYGCPKEEIIRRTTANAKVLFGIK